MGGALAFYYAVKHPGLFGHVTPYAGTYHHQYADKIRGDLHIDIRIGTDDILICDNEIMHLYLNALDIPHEGNTAAPCVTVSIGGASGEVSLGQTWEEYVKRADEALYMSKQSGRNRYTFLKMAATGEKS